MPKYVCGVGAAEKPCTLKLNDCIQFSSLGIFINKKVQNFKN
jgi:hypothetical protein